MIPLTDLAAEELRHSEQLVAEEDRECKGCVESRFTGKSYARKLLSLLTSGIQAAFELVHTRPGKPTPGAIVRP